MSALLYRPDPGAPASRGVLPVDARRCRAHVASRDGAHQCQRRPEYPAERPRWCRQHWNLAAGIRLHQRAGAPCGLCGRVHPLAQECV